MEAVLTEDGPEKKAGYGKNGQTALKDVFSRFSSGRGRQAVTGIFFLDFHSVLC
jgi:hypothetical protein